MSQEERREEEENGKKGRLATDDGDSDDEGRWCSFDTSHRLLPVSFRALLQPLFPFPVTFGDVARALFKDPAREKEQERSASLCFFAEAPLP